MRRGVLAAPRDRAALHDEVQAMREKVRHAHPVKGDRFDVKHSTGGMMDVEFAVQTLVLVESGAHAELLDNVGNIALLGRAEAAGLLPPGSGWPPPTPTASCAGRSTAPGSTSRPPSSTRRRWPRRALPCSRSGVPSSAEAARPSGDAGRSWLTVAVLFGIGAIAVVAAPSTALDWQPALAAREPWRAWSAALVHLSTMHLAANLAGAVLVGALGFVAGVPLRSVSAWLVAWPLTQLTLLARPDLSHYAGLSGVLHAGVAVVAVHLIAVAHGARQAIGFALLAALALKGRAKRNGLARPAIPRLGHRRGAVSPARLVAGALVSTLAEAAARWHRLTMGRND